jgi:hypothetical protein
MTYEEQKKKLKRELRKTPKTGAELGKAIGFSGRGVGRALAQMVDDGEAKKIDGRPPTYTKP